jgi:hypothetical protein
MSNWQKRGCQLLANMVSVVVLLAVAAPAGASNLTLDVGARVASSPGSCTLFVPFATGSGIGDGEDCTGATGMAIFANGQSTNQSEGGYTISAPAGITINQVWVPNGDMSFSDPGGEYAAGEHWDNGGDVHWSAGQTASNTIDQSANINSSYWQFWLSCTATAQIGNGFGCPDAADANIGGLYVYATESTAPSLTADGNNNIWAQSGNWIWNTPSDPWAAAISGNDTTGICSAYVRVDGISSQLTQAQTQTAWQQCPQLNWSSPTVDTSQYADGTSGQISLTLGDTNAAGLSSTDSETLNVDNVAPTLTITPLNDADPGGWAVNHAVSLRVTPQTGPSGISALSCTDNGNPLTLTADSSVSEAQDVSVDGNGVHNVACTIQNNAINPQGQHNTGSAAAMVDIDEQPPTMSFEATNPADPDQVIVDTSDNESPVAGGSIQITPQGSSTPTALPTTFNSAGQLTATIPDASLKAGPYTLQASATSQVGNTGTITEPVGLPLRTASSSIVSFKKIVDPRLARKVKERVRVGFHYVTVKKHGKKVKVKKGGHYKTITVIKRVERCTTTRVKIAKHKYKLKRTCKAPKLTYTRKATVGHGKKVKIYGELTTSQNVALAGQTVEILARPKNGDGKTRQIGTATTNATGGWSARVAAGPSRTIKGYYAGVDTVLPTSGSAQLLVRARIDVSASVTKLPWNGIITIHGKLKGGYVPHDGVALRLLIKLPGRKQLYSPVAFRTTSNGTFSVRWTWGTGRGVAKYPFSVATTANESDYPFVAASSRALPIEFGVKTPKAKKRPVRRRK